MASYFPYHKMENERIIKVTGIREKIRGKDGTKNASTNRTNKNRKK